MMKTNACRTIFRLNNRIVVFTMDNYPRGIGLNGVSPAPSIKPPAPQLIQRRISIDSFDEHENEKKQSVDIKYEDAANMFNLQDKQIEEDDNNNGKHADKVKSFAFYDSESTQLSHQHSKSV
eukprot:466152_1